MSTHSRGFGLVQAAAATPRCAASLPSTALRSRSLRQPGGDVGIPGGGLRHSMFVSSEGPSANHLIACPELTKSNSVEKLDD